MKEQPFDRRSLRSVAQMAGRDAGHALARTLEVVDGTCATCGDEIGDVWGRFEERCSCTRTAAERVSRQVAEENHGRAVAGQWESAGIPRLFRDARFSSFEHRPGTEKALAATRRWADAFERDQSMGLYLVGPWGSGKTHLAVSAAFRAMERTLVRPLFVDPLRMIGAVKGGEGITMEPVRRAGAAELLILDDIGQAERTEFDREILFNVVSERYNEARPMLVTSNLPPARLAGSLGGALASRLLECCRVEVLTASDYRKEARS